MKPDQDVILGEAGDSISNYSVLFSNIVILDIIYTPYGFLFLLIVKLGSRSKVHLKSLIRDLDLELVAIIARLHPPTQQTFLSRITLKSLNV